MSLTQNKVIFLIKVKLMLYMDVLAHLIPRQTLLELEVMEIRKYKIFPEIREKMSKNYVFAQK